MSGLFDKPPLSDLRRESRRVLDSRCFRIDWETGQPWRPWFCLRAGYGGRTSRNVYLEVGRLHVRWAPYSKADWADSPHRKFRVWGPKVSWIGQPDGSIVRKVGR